MSSPDCTTEEHLSTEAQHNQYTTPMPVHPASQHVPLERKGMMVSLISESQQKMSRNEDEEQCSSNGTSRRTHGVVSRTQSAALVTGSNHTSSSGDEKCSSLRTSSAHSKESQGDIEYAVSADLASTHHHGERRRPQKEREDYLRMVRDSSNELKASSQVGRRKQSLSSSVEMWNSGASSGSDGGYDASASSSDSGREHSGSSSPSLSCDDMHSASPEAKQSLTSKIHPSSHKRSSYPVSSSSEIPDFSPGESGMGLDKLSDMSTQMAHTTKNRKRSRSKQGKRTFESGAMFPRGKRPKIFEMLSSRPVFDLSCNRQSSVTGITGGRLLGRSIERVSKRQEQQHEQNQLKESYMSALTHSNEEEAAREANSSSISKKRSPRQMSFKALQNSTQETSTGTPGIFSLGTDTMAQCLSFLEPGEVYSLLTVPISREWRRCFTAPKELWRVLCLSEPFKAKLDAGGDDELFDDSSDTSYDDHEIKHLFGKFRLLYTSFVRCTRYLATIKDDAVNGRPPSAIDDVGGNIYQHSFNSNSNLKSFLARARTVLRQNSSLQGQKHSGSESSASQLSNFSFASANNEENAVTRNKPEADTGVTEVSGSFAENSEMISKNTKHGNSKDVKSILGRMKADDREGEAELPWSCAIYSLVNWMAFFSDVEGIQVMCLKVLPFLLDDENQRTTSQRAGLTDLVLRGMVLFPDSVELHTAAFHALVLLARPLGGKEGMLFHSVMVNASSIFNRGNSSGEHGMAVMLDSMKRFEENEVLQAMSCWSMVNIALIPAQKIMLVKLGGIASAANAMMNHPYNAEVQFRALFALINLVIPSENQTENSEENEVTQEPTDDPEITCPTEREMQDENVSQIANLVVVAMKNFCSSEAILNRACLVLHNLSLNEDYHTTLLWTPNCYQMLEWCIANYRHDHVLQQSAGGTLQRLQATLSSDNDLRMRFLAALAQQQNAQEQTRRDEDHQEDRTTSDEVIHA